MCLTSTVSADGTDGEGAKTATIIGVDSAWTWTEETLSFVTYGITTTTNYFNRVFGLEISSAGIKQQNEGQVFLGTGDVTSQEPANVYSYIDSGHNKALHGNVSIPSSHSAYIYNANFSVSSGGDVALDLEIKKFGEVYRRVYQGFCYNNINNKFMDLPIAVPEKSDIRINAKASSNGVKGGVEMDVLIVPSCFNNFTM
jgi:hypothetical protein